MPRFIFPPRPRGKINPSDLPHYERSGLWIAHRKYNDTRSVLHIEPGFKMTAWTRHGTPHKRFILTQSLRSEIISNLNIDKNLEYWLDGGVMNKHKGAAGNELVFFDILHTGKYLFLQNQMKRLDILSKLCGNPTEQVPLKLQRPGHPYGIALKISEHLWMAPVFTSDFVARFEESFEDDRIEGLVLRKKNSVLDNYGRVYYEINWQIRCRKPCQMYNL